MTAAKHLAMLERRLRFLADSRTSNAMAAAELAALRWAVPLLRPVADKEAQRPHLGVACPACSTAAGFICAHLPRRT